MSEPRCKRARHNPLQNHAEWAVRSVQRTVEQWARLGKNGKPQHHEYTIAAAILVTLPEEPSCSHVVSIGTGTKCLPAIKRCCNGGLLNDSHAEMVARRACLAWVWAELLEAVRKPREGSFFRWDEDECRFFLRDGVCFHMYVSQPPCGDACIFSTQDQSKSNLAEPEPYCLMDASGSKRTSQSKAANVPASQSQTMSDCFLTKNGTECGDSQPNLQSKSKSDSKSVVDQNQQQFRTNGTKSLIDENRQQVKNNRSESMIDENQQQAKNNVAESMICETWQKLKKDETGFKTGSSAGGCAEGTNMEVKRHGENKEIAAARSHAGGLTEHCRGFGVAPKSRASGFDCERAAVERGILDCGNTMPGKREGVDSAGGGLGGSNRRGIGWLDHMEARTEGEVAASDHVPCGCAAWAELNMSAWQGQDLMTGGKQGSTPVFEGGQGQNVAAKGSDAAQRIGEERQRHGMPGAKVEREGGATLSTEDHQSSGVKSRTGAKPLGALQLVTGHQGQSPFPAGAAGGLIIPSAHDVESGPQSVGLTRRKPGKGAATLSMSCSDKISRWGLLGFQGSLLSGLLAAPLRFSTLVVGCPVAAYAAVGPDALTLATEAVSRAIGVRCEHLRARLAKQQGAHYEPMKLLVVPPPEEALGWAPTTSRKSAAGVAVNWSVGMGALLLSGGQRDKGSKSSNVGGAYEVTLGAEGRKAGAAKTGSGWASPKTRSRLSKAAMMERARELLGTLPPHAVQVLLPQLPSIEGCTYAQLKHSLGAQHQAAWRLIQQPPSLFELWIHKPREHEGFICTVPQS